MSTPEVEALFEQAIAHVNAGELKQGRALLERVLEQDPKNDQAWVWLSGCVEDPMQRRVCLQQALSANPENQAALDGMKVLDGELVQAAEVPPSLLESRLSAIGMGDRPATRRPPAAISPSPSSDVVSPAMPMPSRVAEKRETDEIGEKPGRRRIVLLIAAVLVLFLCVCALVVRFVGPSLLESLF